MVNAKGVSYSISCKAVFTKLAVVVENGYVVSYIGSFLLDSFIRLNNGPYLRLKLQTVDC